MFAAITTGLVNFDDWVERRRVKGKLTLLRVAGGEVRRSPGPIACLDKSHGLVELHLDSGVLFVGELRQSFHVHHVGRVGGEAIQLGLEGAGARSRPTCSGIATRLPGSRRSTTAPQSPPIRSSGSLGTGTSGWSRRCTATWGDPAPRGRGGVPGGAA